MKSLIASQTSGLHQRFRFTALWEGQRVEVSEAAYKAAVLAELISVGCTASNPVDLYLIGPALVAAGYTQQQIVAALDSLAHDKRVDYVGGNRVRLKR